MSDLMKISRAMEDQHFQWRVAAAMVVHAQTVYGAAPAGSKEKALALHVMSNPTTAEISMLALVASDSAVVQAVTLTGPENEIPETDNVADTDIKRVVVAMWTPVAGKYAA